MLGLARVSEAGRIRAAVYDGESDRVAVVGDDLEWTSAIAVLHESGTTSFVYEDWRPATSVAFLPPVAPSSRVFCVAQNYSAHAQESSGAESPPEPVVFLKPLSALVGHESPTALVAATSFFDWEAELAVVVGADLREGTESEARACIAGYTIANDGTARDLQPIDLGGRRIVDWFSAKSIDRSSAMGPAVFPATEVEDESALHLRLTVNGEVMQDDVAGSMTVTSAALLARISRIVELHPGDVLLTGTPAGVGRARGVSLSHGDEIEISLGGLGTLVTRVERR